ncbi:MAG: DUF262 domain-containing HNH endonuclease family protein [Bacteroidales bacterium]|nr:DUF262 domain-containing HNH endonuclease family protein [Bacteroidales bacterium]
MEASTTIKQMLARNKIFVPDYQRAYSWDTEFDRTKPKKQVNVFLSDLEDYNKSKSNSKYYFGHFLFEEKGNNEFNVIDGQQRITTIIIFLSALFCRLKQQRPLEEKEQESFEDMIKRNSTYRFETVGYDKQLFIDYVVNQTKKDKKNLKTVSAKRIVNAYDFFERYLETKDEPYLLQMLNTIQNASCTTHPVKDESEAIQMFIFQNNRGKKPSNLEIIKAQFMYNIHLYGGDDKLALIEEIKLRFETIYASISEIEGIVNEDDILVYTLRVYFNSLRETYAPDRIGKILSYEDSISFIKSFSMSLSESFEYLKLFFGKDEKSNIEIHSLIVLKGFALAIPFIIKAYKYDLPIKEICKICSSLESLIIRHRLIGTRADIISRINEVFQKFTYENQDIQPIVDRINWIKNAPNTSWWWAYWNNEELERAIQGGLNHSIAKFILWKYENYLENQGKSGYSLTRFDKIDNPELEHIAPKTPTNNEPLAAGYCDYDEEFINQYLDCLGNYLLISKSHNCSLGNIAFSEKRKTYTYLKQQREIQEMTKDNEIWDKEKINQRKEKIIRFILENL